MKAGGNMSNPSMMAEFDIYKNNLLDWNNRINLTAITDDEGIRYKHFEDSLSLLPFLPNTPFSMIDVGTGAGFPGIPIKIVRPDAKVTLLDSLRKRIYFLEDTIKKLELTDINCIHARAEDLQKDINHANSYDIVTARAVARLDKLCKWCLPFVKPGGLFLAMKGPTVEEEINESKEIIRKLKGEVEGVEYVEIMPGVVHSVVVVCYNGEGCLQ